MKQEGCKDWEVREGQGKRWTYRTFSPLSHAGHLRVACVSKSSQSKKNIERVPCVEAQEHSQRVFALCFGGSRPWQRYRAYVLKRLYNGELRRTDQIQHQSSGVAGTKAGLLELFCAVGLTCLLPRRRLSLIQRNERTGSARLGRRDPRIDVGPRHL